MNYLFSNNTQSNSKQTFITKRTNSSVDSNYYICSSYTNDASCIQSAINNAESGSEIIFLPGTYNITSPISIAGKNLSLTGRGDVTFIFSVSASENATLAFSGTQIATPTLSTDAAKGALSISVVDASGIQSGDLIKIYKNVKWSPTDYANQQTGEMYEISSVSGTTLYLNQALLRPYTIAETVSIQIYRAPEVHISNIKIQDAGSTTSHAAISLTRCKNSSVNDCTIIDSGLYAIGFYSCYNVKAQRNIIKNCLLAGSGYGVSVWNGSAYTDISHNHIENCRHCVTANASEYLALVRDVVVDNNTLIGSNITGANALDAHAVTYSYYVTNNRIFLRGGFTFAFLDGAQISRFSYNEIYTGYGAVSRRGVVSGGYHIIENNKMCGCNGPLYQAGSGGVNDTLVIRDNDVDDGEYGIDFRSAETYDKYIITGNIFNSLSQNGIHLDNLPTGCKIDISNNKLFNTSKVGIYIEGTNGANHFVDITNNKIINPNVANSGYAGISCVYLTNATFENNKIYDYNARSGSAIVTDNTCDYNVFIGNIAKGMTGTKFNLLGSNNTNVNNISL